MPSSIERAYDPAFSATWPVAVRASGFVFTAAFDGRTSGSMDIAAQCNAVYRAQQVAAARFNVPLTNAVRLDHFTQSQSWLKQRQAVRARFFGQPARITSTGVATHLDADNLLTSALVCIADGAGKQVLVPGTDYGMPLIATLVRGGPLLFMSGILQSFPSSRNEDAETAFAISIAECIQTISDVLQQGGCATDRVLRQDIYIAEAMPRQALDDALAAHLPGSRAVVRALHMPFARPDVVEVTTLAAVGPPAVLAGGFTAAAGLVFSPAFAADSVDGALDDFAAAIAAAGLTTRQVVRLDLAVAQPGDIPQARERCAQHWPEDAPALVLHAGSPVSAGRAQVMGILQA